MQGYSFVDEIKARNRREKRLEEELAHRRARQERMDSIVYENQRFNREDRQRQATARSRDIEARSIQAAPGQTDLDALEEYVDVPWVADFIRKERAARKAKGEFETAFQGDPNYRGGLQQQASDAAQPPPDPNDPTQLGTTQVIGGATGVDPVAPAPSVRPPDVPDLTRDQLKEQVLTGKMPEEEAMQIRNERMADPGSRSTLLGITPDNMPGSPEYRDLAKAKQERANKQIAAVQETRAAERIAKSFADINDASGDVYRNWSPQQATQWYHQNRNNIEDPILQRDMDQVMLPRTEKMLNATRAIMDDRNVPVDSQEFRNAQRNHAKALGLREAMATQRDPAALAGDDGRGPSRRNRAMLDNMSKEAADSPRSPLPGHPDKHRADMTVANRGDSGTRVGRAYKNAAYGLLSREVIDVGVYNTMINTGAPLGEILAAQGIKTEIVQGSPTQDTFIQRTGPNGVISRELIIPARKVPTAKEQADLARNNFGGAAVKHLYERLAPTYNTDSDKERGTRLVNTFIRDMSINEAKARAAGYSFNNLADLNLLFARWNDMHVVRDIYNREVSNRKFWFDKPTYTQAYGQIDERIFDRNFDTKLRQMITEEKLTTPSGAPIRLTGLKDISAADVEYVMSVAPEATAGMSPEQVAELIAQDAAGQ